MEQHYAATAPTSAHAPPDRKALPAVRAEDVVSIDLAAAIFGLTRKAIEGKIYRGQWLESREYHRDPTGAIWIDVKGVKKWVVSGRA